MTTTKEMQALSTEPFQDGIYFVVPNGARVTLRCAICNSSDVQRSRSVWHELLKAGVRQPTAPCEVFFCRQHAPSLTGLIFISLLTMLLGAVSMVSVLILALPDLWTFWIVSAGAANAALDAGILVWLYRWALLPAGLRIVRVHEGHAWVRGAGTPFLQSLPPIPAQLH